MDEFANRCVSGRRYRGWTGIFCIELTHRQKDATDFVLFFKEFNISGAKNESPRDARVDACSSRIPGQPIHSIEQGWDAVSCEIEKPGICKTAYTTCRLSIPIRSYHGQRPANPRQMNAAPTARSPNLPIRLGEMIAATTPTPTSTEPSRSLAGRFISRSDRNSSISVASAKGW